MAWKLLYLFVIVTAILGPCIIYLETRVSEEFSRKNSTTETPSHSGTESHTGQLSANSTTQQRKVLLAFRYLEQLTMTTNNLLQLTALAAFGGRQVVVPFVKDSFFYGTATDKGNQTLELYYNITALSDTLRSHGHATFISWKEFQSVCKGRLDVLVRLDYSNLGKTQTYSAAKPFIPCAENEKILQGIKIGKSICLNVFALDSGERFENEAVKKLPCVGFFAWAGIIRGIPHRAQFDLKPVVSKVLSHSDVDAFFNSKFLDTARSFIEKHFPPQFISVHIRVESILWNGGNLPFAKKCISDLTEYVQKIMNANNAMPVFLATDFSEFGSNSHPIAGIKQQISPSLMEILSPLKAITFKPSEYRLSDRGAVMWPLWK